MLRCPTSIFRRLKSTRSSSPSYTHTYTDLESYFKYAETIGLSTETTSFVGTSYELLVQRELTRLLNMKKLTHQGGSFDNGVDLKGKWDLTPYKPADRKTNEPAVPLIFKGKKIKPIVTKKRSLLVDVLVQCKNRSVKLTAKEVREMSGIFNFNVSSSKKSMTLMFLCSPSVLTPQGIAQMNVVDIPIIYIWLERLRKRSPSVDDYDLSGYEGGQLKGFFCNDFSKALLDGTTVNTDIAKLVESW